MVRDKRDGRRRARRQDDKDDKVCDVDDALRCWPNARHVVDIAIVFSTCYVKVYLLHIAGDELFFFDSLRFCAANRWTHWVVQVQDYIYIPSPGSVNPGGSESFLRLAGKNG